MTAVPIALDPRRPERRYYSSMALLMSVVVLVGFARTYYLAPLFPDIVATLAPPEPFFYYVHGVVLTMWMVLMVVQPLLVANKRVDLHRRLGWFGAGVAIVVVVVSTAGALMAARRGFIGIPPGSSLIFLSSPLKGVSLFVVFVGLAILWRRDTQSHKRLMLLGTLALIESAVVRMPYADMFSPVLWTFTLTDIGVDVFLIPMIIWDLWSRGSIHRVTLAGALIVVAAQPLRLVVSETQLWLRFATWAVGLPGH